MEGWGLLAGVACHAFEVDGHAAFHLGPVPGQLAPAMAPRRRAGRRLASAPSGSRVRRHTATRWGWLVVPRPSPAVASTRRDRIRSSAAGTVPHAEVVLRGTWREKVSS